MKETTQKTNYILKISWNANIAFLYFKKMSFHFYAKIDFKIEVVKNTHLI